MKARLLSIGIVFVSLPTTALSQGGSAPINAGTRQGPTSGLAFGLSLRGTGPETVLVKAPLRQATPPTAWSRAKFPSGPKYSAADQFQSLASLVRIDGHSTGSDIIPNVDVNGIPMVQALGGWMGVVVSVKDGQAGKPGSLIEAAKAAGRSSGSDLFSYYLTESTGIASALAGETHVSQTREMMGLGSNSGEDIDALDFGLGVRSHAQQTEPGILFANGVDYFFSVTPLSATLLNVHTNGAFALDPLQAWVPAHPADVYRLIWSNGAWTGPFRYRSALNDLGLTLPNEDIDGLAVDPNTGVTVFSTQVVTGRSQLQIHDPMYGTFPFRELDSSLVTEHIGGIDDLTDIDSICILDPPENSPYSAFFGTPVSDSSFNAFGPLMGLSVTRASSDNSDEADRLHCQLSGRRGPAFAPTLVLFMISGDYSPANGWSAATWIPINDDNPASLLRIDDGKPFDNVFEYSWKVPPTSQPLTASVCAMAFDLNGNLIGVSWVARVTLP